MLNRQKHERKLYMCSSSNCVNIYVRRKRTGRKQPLRVSSGGAGAVS